jgi:hypothetical protein
MGIALRPGRAVVVVLGGTRRTPRMVLRHEVHLADPWVPESMHPYHVELGNGGPPAARACRRGCSAARAATDRTLRAFVREMRAHGFEPRGAALIVRPGIDPARIRGAHARAHAAEERLYREAVDASLRRCGLRPVCLAEGEVRPAAARRLGLGAEAIAATLRAFSHAVGTPWRAPEKHAALGAWMRLP